MRKSLSLIFALIASLIAMGWTGTGETSDPLLAFNEIPADIANACALMSVGEVVACHKTVFDHRWVGHSGRGDLFVVTNNMCAGSGCRAWLVERESGSTATLLTFENFYRLYDGADNYPVIETYTELSATQGAYSRFEWNGARYMRTFDRLVYQIDGTECGTRAECILVARQALKHRQVDRAVKILEQVNGVSWI